MLLPGAFFKDAKDARCPADHLKQDQWMENAPQLHSTQLCELLLHAQSVLIKRTAFIRLKFSAFLSIFEKLGHLAAGMNMCTHALMHRSHLHNSPDT